MAAFIPFCLIIILLSCFVLWTRRKLYKLSWQLDGPIALPIIGNRLSVKPNNIFPQLDAGVMIYKSPIRLWFGPLLFVFIADAGNAEVILKSKDCLNKPEMLYKIIRQTLSFDGLFTLEENKWKVHRRLVGPALNLSSVSAHLPIFNQNIRKAVADLPCDGEFFDILVPLNMCKMTMFLEASLGATLDADTKQKYIQIFADGIKIMTQRMLRPIYYIDSLWNLTKWARRLREYRKFGREMYNKMLNRKLDVDGVTFLEKLYSISLENPEFTTDDVMAETASILAGATDTSSVSSAFVTVMLAMHPEYQEKVYKEIISVIPDESTNPTQSDFDKLKFTELCIQETLRLFPSVPLIARYSTKPITLTNGVVVPPNVPMIVGLRQIHLQEKYFGPTAHLFNPNRFLDNSLDNLPKAAYIPFSFGPRNCIGVNYASVSVKCFIVHLIRHYHVTTIYNSIDELKLLQNGSLRIVDKHMVRLERRNQHLKP